MILLELTKNNQKLIPQHKTMQTENDTIHTERPSGGTPKINLELATDVIGVALARIVRRALVWVDGSDYKERFLRLTKSHALNQADPLLGSRGSFKPACGKRTACEVTGLILTNEGVRTLMIRYTTPDGDVIDVARIPHSAFRPATCSPSSVKAVCPNCNNLRYIQDAGFACCSVCNSDNSFYAENAQDQP